jgi:predicted nucleic acid-binding protein
VNKPAVINASPLIFFSRGQQMELLRHFAGRILVPEPVADEILMKGAADITAKALDSASWLEIVPVKPIPEKILEWGLGPGESSVLTYADEHPQMEAIIDDLAGRKCADYLNIPVRGTLGIVLVSKKRGFIPKARPVMESLIRSGLYLSRPVLDEALKRVGE